VIPQLSRIKTVIRCQGIPRYFGDISSIYNFFTRQWGYGVKLKIKI
jgi:hypothetical protein